MKRVTKIVFISLIVLFGANTLQAESNLDNKSRNMVELMRLAMSSRVMIQNIAKDYLYIGNNVATSRAEKELQTSEMKFNSKIKQLNISMNDPKIKNLLLFIESNYDDIKELLKGKYSLDNAQEIIDLAEAISEGSLSIASKIKIKIKGKVPVFKGQRYYTTQVAKYYMAYKAGIKDKNTILNMNNAVKKLGGLIDEVKSYQGNSPEMNQLANKIDKQWKIVHKFYLDIEDGDLPLIVYDTTNKLNKQFIKYVNLTYNTKQKK